MIFCLEVGGEFVARYSFLFYSLTSGGHVSTGQKIPSGNSGVEYLFFAFYGGYTAFKYDLCPSIV